MTDRELLELAAKAAGYEIDPINAALDPDDWFCTNPLNDDGDSFALAVALSIDVMFRDTSAEVSALAPMCRMVVEPYGGDKHQAARRAIVRAAAEIGRSMP